MRLFFDADTSGFESHPPCRDLLAAAWRDTQAGSIVPSDADPVMAIKTEQPVRLRPAR